MSCEICQMIEDRKDIEVVYEDEKTIVILSDKPVSLGHMIIFPKTHYKSIDLVPLDDIAHFYYTASFVATALFEYMGPSHDKGTNIITNEGIGTGARFNHFHIEVILRKHEDGLDYRWEPKPAKPEDLAESEKKIKDEAFIIGKKGKQNPVKSIAKPENSPITNINDDEDEETNYLVEQFNRIP
jgi:histidine triad (HIT) family protein